MVAASAAICAANGVLLREPLNPTLPALAQATVWPSMSAIVTIVLLNVDWTWAMPLMPTFRSRFFLGFGVDAACSATFAPSSQGRRAGRAALIVNRPASARAS